jgi:hypothetical protein
MTGAAESSQVDRAGGITLDDLRRQRGEGWQWARAQTDRCPQCGHHPAAMERSTLGAQCVSANLWQFARTSVRWRVTRRTNRVIDENTGAHAILVRALGPPS